MLLLVFLLGWSGFAYAGRRKANESSVPTSKYISRKETGEQSNCGEPAGEQSAGERGQRFSLG